MGNMGQLVVMVLLLFLMSGCAMKSLVALVPDPDGTTGSITVNNEVCSVTLDKPYQATSIGDAKEQPTPPEHIGKEALDKIFADALSIQPSRPIHFLLYFEKNTTLTSDSAKLLPDIIKAIQERNSTDISIVGHTDTVGSKEYNTMLSSNRATAVKELLVNQGAESIAIQTTSHGKENPLVPTGDNVNEPRNRRVEVVVR